MKGRRFLPVAAVLIGNSLATSAWADACEASMRRVDTFGRVEFGAPVPDTPSWARPHPRCGAAMTECESFIDPEGVTYTVVDEERMVIDKLLHASTGNTLPWGLQSGDAEDIVARKLAALLPGAEIVRGEGEGQPALFLMVPGCEFEWLEIEVGPHGVEWLSINAQP